MNKFTLKTVLGYFLTPTEAVRCGREPGFSRLTQILLLFVSSALATLSHFALYKAAGVNMVEFFRARHLPMLTSASGAEATMLELYIDIFAYLFGNPLLMTIYSFGVDILLCFSIVFVTRQFNRTDTINADMSGLSQVVFVSTVTNALLTSFRALLFLLSSDLGIMAENLFNYLNPPFFVWQIFMLKGAINSKSIFGTLGILILALLFILVILIPILMIVVPMVMILYGNH